MGLKRGLVNQVVLAAAALVCSLAAQAQAPSAASTTPAAARPSPALAQCAAVNRVALAELSQSLKTHEERNRINPLVVSRLKNLGAEAANLRVRSLREVRTLRECEALDEAIANLNERLSGMVGADPQVADCVAGNAQALHEALESLAAQEADGAAGARAAAAVRAARSQLNGMRSAVTREGQTLAGCRQLGLNLEEVARQVSSQSGVPASANAAAGGEALRNCRAANVDAYAETLMAWRAAATARRLRVGQPEWDEATRRMLSLRDQVAQQGFSMRECEALADALRREGQRAEGAPETGPGQAAGGELPVGAVLQAPLGGEPAPAGGGKEGGPAAGAPAGEPVPAPAERPASAAG